MKQVGSTNYNQTNLPPGYVLKITGNKVELNKIIVDDYIKHPEKLTERNKLKVFRRNTLPIEIYNCVVIPHII